MLPCIVYVYPLNNSPNFPPIHRPPMHPYINTFSPRFLLPLPISSQTFHSLYYHSLTHSLTPLLICGISLLLEMLPPSEGPLPTIDTIQKHPSFYSQSSLCIIFFLPVPFSNDSAYEPPNKHIVIQPTLCCCLKIMRSTLHHTPTNPKPD